MKLRKVSERHLVDERVSDIVLFIVDNHAKVSSKIEQGERNVEIKRLSP
jgi:hypothetical protein